ncbi:MAG: response regulator [Pseudomonadota bacterium]
MVKILILEDDETFGGLMAEQLMAEGHSADLFRSLSPALESLRTTTYDVVIADLLIKAQDRYQPEGGLTLIQKLKTLSFDRGRKIPVIAISGSIRNPGMERSLAIARRMGADAALAKPFQPDALSAVVRKVLTPKHRPMV